MDRLSREFKKSIRIMNRLRSRQGCPWDREQTVETLKKYIIEEAYEVVEALESKNTDHVVEELGDLFFQILFQSRIGNEKGRFRLADVFEALNKKMIRRHPHVFKKGRSIKDSSDVLKSWTQSKKKEGKKSVIEGVPVSMPALLQAFRITEKASTVGFDWVEAGPVMDKLDEEISELKSEVKAKGRSNKKKVADEIGDILFTVVNLSRLMKIDPESSLNRTIKKFKRRFNHIEKGLKKRNKDIRSTDLDEMEMLWCEAKDKGL